MAIFVEASENEFVVQRHPLSKAIISLIYAQYLANGAIWDVSY